MSVRARIMLVAVVAAVMLGLAVFAFDAISAGAHVLGLRPLP